jgi:hypothetical protein
VSRFESETDSSVEKPMGRRSRSGVADTEEEVAKLTLDQIDAEIQRCLDGAFSGGQGSQGRKAYFKRLVWMEKMRENIHGIPAPRRVWHR